MKNSLLSIEKLKKLKEFVCLWRLPGYCQNLFKICSDNLLHYVIYIYSITAMYTNVNRIYVSNYFGKCFETWQTKATINGKTYLICTSSYRFQDNPKNIPTSTIPSGYDKFNKIIH